jgi:hypothetical protein
MVVRNGGVVKSGQAPELRLQRQKQVSPLRASRSDRADTVWAIVRLLLLVLVQQQMQRQIPFGNDKLKKVTVRG